MGKPSQILFITTTAIWFSPFTLLFEIGWENIDFFFPNLHVSWFKISIGLSLAGYYYLLSPPLKLINNNYVCR